MTLAAAPHLTGHALVSMRGCGRHAHIHNRAAVIVVTRHALAHDLVRNHRRRAIVGAGGGTLRDRTHRHLLVPDPGSRIPAIASGERDGQRR
jgi:hypothetical protein